MRLLVPALLAALLLGACALSADDLGRWGEPEPVEVRLHGPSGQLRVFSAEVAADPASRRRGLMHRTELAPRAGMLFLFPDDTARGFWMKDTLVPLSIAFVRADGTVAAVRDMEPCAAAPCPVYRPGVLYRMALEVNRGALEGVGPGWRLEVDGTLRPPR